jgi:Domain of unknown function (DUF4190)
MKRCPTCNRTFEEDWLAFCTQDGATLIDDSRAKTDEPPPTILAPPPPPPGGWQQPSGGFGSGQFQSQPIPPPPSNVGASSGGFAPAPFQGQQQMQSGWQPPPPPPYAQGQKQGLALASMICGLFTITFGWCCSIGVISGIVAIVLGAYQLVQIKNKPEENGGKPLAIVGVITASLYFVIWVLLMVLYGFAIFMGNLK